MARKASPAKLAAHKTLNGKGKEKKKNDGMKPLNYPTYSFTNRDPVLAIVEETMELEEVSKSAIREASHVSVTTLSNWKKKTKRPQFATVAAVMGAMGYEPVWKVKELGKKRK